MKENIIVIRDPKTFCFNFDWPKDNGENSQHKIEFIIKRNESVAENEIVLGTYCVSDLQDYIELNIKKHETLTAAPSIAVCINRINNRLIFELKDGYKLEFQTPETMKLFSRTKKLIDKTRNGENVSGSKVAEVFLVIKIKLIKEVIFLEIKFQTQ